MACPEVKPNDFTPEQILPFLPPGCTGEQWNLDLVLYLIYKVIVILSWTAEVAAIFLLVYAGFLYVASAGDEGKIGTAKKIIAAVAIGIIIVMLARWSMSALINNVADDSTNIVNQIPNAPTPNP